MNSEDRVGCATRDQAISVYGRRSDQYCQCAAMFRSVRAQLLMPIVVLLIVPLGSAGCTSSEGQAAQTASPSQSESVTPTPMRETPTPTPTSALALPTPEPTPWSDVLIDGYAKILAGKDGASFCAVFRQTPRRTTAVCCKVRPSAATRSTSYPALRRTRSRGPPCTTSVRDNCPDLLPDVEASLVSDAAGDPYVFAGVY